MTTAKIIARIERELALPGLFAALSEHISATDLTSLLLEVFRARTADATVAEILNRFESSPLVRPSKVDPRVKIEIDRIALRVAAAFEAVELAPVAPLGTVRALGGLDQNNVLAAIRGVEHLADPTDVWALLAAQRRRNPASRAGDVKICGNARLMRLQPFTNPDHSPHFALFAMVSAGRDRGGWRFESEALAEHIAVYLDFFRALGELGYRFANPVVEISDTELVAGLLEARGVSLDEVRKRARAHDVGGAAKYLAERGVVLPGDVRENLGPRLQRAHAEVANLLASRFPEAVLRVDGARLEGLGYYSGLIMRIRVTDPSGTTFSIADGGFTTWTQRLLDDKKERFIGSGIGTELIAKRFQPGK